ncbi:hypothetical protein GGI1_03416 [Acidithiobacillus sp. GGI-221]|nr:hypothetical protein GGI1_03416 [Acidithiobacillus sp. GGI-221]
MPQDKTSQTSWKNVPEKPTQEMNVAGVLALTQGKPCAGIYEAMLAAAPRPPKEAIPPEVMAALDRMCTPLDESYLKGITAQEDAKCMALIRDYILKDTDCSATDAL